jgi:hypothetical protein
MDQRRIIKVISGTASGTLIAAVLLFVPLPTSGRLAIFLALLLWLSYGCGGRFITRQTKHLPITRLVLGLITVLLGLVIFLAVCFYINQFSRLTVLGCFFFLSFLAASGQSNKTIAEPTSSSKQSFSVWSLILFLGVIFGDAILLISYLSVRTSDPIRTPWDVLPWSALILFGVSTWLLLLLCHERLTPYKKGLIALHLFTAYSLSEIVIALGFGFDPFIHRTAEAFIVEHGFIQPKQPYYTGFYVLVAAVNWLTGLSVDIIDRWLILILGPLTLPWVIPFGLKKAWKLTTVPRIFLTPLILLIPQLSLTFTVPHSLTVLLLFWLSFLAPLVLKNRSYLWLIISLTLAIILIHPLLGAAAFGLLVALALQHWRNSWLINLAIIFINAAILPLMFALHNIRQNSVPFNFINPLTQLERFTGLFANPYNSNPQIIFSFWDILYTYRTFSPILLLIFVAIGSVTLNKKLRQSIVKPYLLTSGGLLLAVFILSTTIIVPGIISSEQLEFSLRLKHSLSILLLPLLLLGIASIFRHWYQINLTPTLAAITFSCALLITAAWYLTYPQANIRAARSGWSVSQADFEAAALIQQVADNQPYIALSNQMLSVAALRRNGFKNFSYALPTGGRLYEYYLILSYYRREPAVMQEALTIYNVPRGFYAVHSYEPEFDRIISELSQSADKIWTVADKQIIIFMFEKML